MRKPASIQFGITQQGPIIWALADDGTVWEYRSTGLSAAWAKIPDLPQDEAAKPQFTLGEVRRVNGN